MYNVVDHRRCFFNQSIGGVLDVRNEKRTHTAHSADTVAGSPNCDKKHGIQNLEIGGLKYWGGGG